MSIVIDTWGLLWQARRRHLVSSPRLRLSASLTFGLLALLSGPSVASATGQKVLLLLVFACGVRPVKMNPLGAFTQLLHGLAAKIKADSKAEAKACREYAERCNGVSANTRNDIKTATSRNEEPEAEINKRGSNIDAGAKDRRTRWCHCTEHV